MAHHRIRDWGLGLLWGVPLARAVERQGAAIGTLVEVGVMRMGPNNGFGGLLHVGMAFCHFWFLGANGNVL